MSKSNKLIKVEEKELNEVKKDATSLYENTSKLVIKSDDDYSIGVEIASKLKQLAKAVKAKKDEVIKPINAGLKAARDLFKPVETSLETAEFELEQKMLAWNAQKRKAAELEAAKIAARVEKGTLKQETADRKLENIVQPVKTVKTDTGAKATEKMLPDYVVSNPELLPRAYLMPDIAKIKADLKAGVSIPGAEIQMRATMSF